MMKVFHMIVSDVKGDAGQIFTHKAAIFLHKSNKRDRVLKCNFTTCTQVRVKRFHQNCEVIEPAGKYMYQYLLRISFMFHFKEITIFYAKTSSFPFQNLVKRKYFI